MQFREKHFDMEDTVGLFVTLEYSSGDSGHLRTQIASPYRWEVYVGLPPGKQQSWREILLRALLQAESGMKFPIRFEHDNLMQFFTILDIKLIEKQIRGVSFWVYGVEKTYSFSDAFIRNAKRIEKLRVESA